MTTIESAINPTELDLLEAWLLIALVAEDAGAAEPLLTSE